MKLNRRAISRQALQSRDELTWVVMLPSPTTRRAQTPERRSAVREHLHALGLAVLLVSFGVALGTVLSGLAF